MQITAMSTIIIQAQFKSIPAPIWIFAHRIYSTSTKKIVGQKTSNPSIEKNNAIINDSNYLASGNYDNEF